MRMTLGWADFGWCTAAADDQALPTFGVIPQFGSSSSMPMDFVPNFNPAKLLHGEQYLRILGPIPTSGTLVNHVKLMEVLDKGKTAAVTVKVDTVNKGTGERIFENQSTVILRGSGGFGGKKEGRGEYHLRDLNVKLVDADV